MNYFEPSNLPKALRKYEDHDFGTQLKVQFAFYLSCALFLLTIPVIINSSYVYTEYHQQIDLSIIIVEIITAFVYLTSAIIITKGFYKQAAYMIFTSSFLALWYVIWTDRTELLMKLNTVEYVLAILSMIPIFFERKKSVIIFTAFNFFMFFMFLLFSDINLDGSVFDFSVTTSISMLFIAIVAYNITRINSLTLNRVYSDLRKIKNAEEALVSEKEKLLVTLKSIGDGVITTDCQGYVVLMNSVAEQLTGWSQPEASGRPLSEVFHIVNEMSGRSCESPVDKVLSSGTVQELENHTMLISKCGLRKIIADSGAPIKDSQGNIIGVVLVFRDMTEKHKLMEAAQQSQKLQSLGTLAGGIAHDFNNLLTGIFGYIGFARDESTEEHIRKMLADAAGTIDRARSLTTQLLTFAKGGAPVRKLQPLSPFIEDAVRFALSGSIVKPEFHIANDLKKVEFDRNQMSQALENIVLNAIQSMPEGGKIQITAGNVENEDKVRISIKDHGTGIPGKVLKNIFDPFFTTKPDGHGLGLAMCYSIISRHDGSIEVESEEGEGSTFHIILPSASFESSRKVHPGNMAVSEGNNAARILVLDDELIVTEIISKIVSRLGYTAVCVHDGESAVNTFIKEKDSGRPFKALIFDLTVPGIMNGKEAIEKIREIDKTVPAFLSTGYAEDPIVADPQAHGFTDSIGKPFDVRELSEKLQKYLN